MIERERSVKRPNAYISIQSGGLFAPPFYSGDISFTFNSSSHLILHYSAISISLRSLLFTFLIVL